MTVHEMVVHESSSWLLNPAEGMRQLKQTGDWETSLQCSENEDSRINICINTVVHFMLQ